MAVGNALVGNMVAGNINSVLSGGGALISGETDGLGIDFTYATDVTKQMRVTTASVPVDSDPATKLTYTSPSVKLTRRASGTWTLTNGTTELPYEWDPTAVPQGVLIEEARTNLLVRSAEIDNATNWLSLRASATANAATAPDGTASADGFKEDGTNNSHVVYQNATVVFGSTYTWSFFAKAANRTQVEIQLARSTFSAGTSTLFDLSTGAVVGTPGGSYGVNVTYVSSSSVDAGNGWWRFIITAIISDTIATCSIDAATGGTSSFQGDGGAANSIYVWGAQLELGSFATSPIATVAAQVTRAADAVSLPTSGFPFSATVGTLVVAAKIPFTPTLGTHKLLADLDDGTANERHTFYISVGGGALEYDVVDGGASQAGLNPANNPAANTAFKLAGAWAANDFAAAKDGGTVVTDASGSLPTVTTLRFGNYFDGSFQTNGYIRQLTYLARRATNGELQTRTT